VSNLEIHLLGEPEVLLRGQPVMIERRITRILLYYLASQNGMINRSRLLPLLWREKEEQSAKANLRQSLHRLRTAFVGTGLLKEQGDLIGIDFNEVEVDLHQFTYIFDLIYPTINRIPLTQPLPNELFLKLSSLDRLWHGTSFLGDTILSDTPELADWFDDMHYRLQHRRRWVLERLSDHAMAIGELQESLNLAGRVLITNETDENLHKRVLLLLLRLNRLAEARDYYKKTIRWFGREGLELSPEFHQQFDYLTNPATRPRPSNKVNWNVYNGIEIPFVGRLSESDLLSQQYLAGGAVFIFGESGLGKTRLLANFANMAYPAPRTILAQARAGESGLPYQPLMDALRRGVQPAEWLRLPSVWANYLSQLLPELLVLRSDLKPPMLVVSLEQARTQLQEALRQLFLKISQNQRLLLIIDDAQWSDEATLAAVEYLISRPPFDKNGLLVISARVEELNPGLQRMHSHMVRDPGVKTIQLEQLKSTEIAQIIQSTLHTSTSSTFIERLTRASGGNPLYIGEILSSLAARSPNELESEKFPTSENLAKFIQARLIVLSQATQRVLEAASVLGYDFSLIDLSSTVQYAPEQLSAALCELEESHLLQINPPQNEIGKVRINFIHDKFREVQLQMISVVQRSLLHRQAARTLEISAGKNLNESAAIIAEHYEQAGDFAEAFHHWVLAGNHSLALYSINEADHAFEKAAALIPFCEKQLGDDAIYELFEIWGDMWSDRNATQILTRLGEQLINLGQARNSSLLLSSGHHRLSNAAFTSNDFQKGIDETSIALDCSSILDHPRLKIRIYWELGVLQFMSGQVKEGEEALKKALQSFTERELKDTLTLEWMAGIYYELGMVKTISGWPSQGNEYAQHALDILQKSQNHHKVMINQISILAKSLIGLTKHYMGQYIDADRHLQESLKPATEAGLWRVDGYIHDYLAMNELTLGNLDEMAMHVEQAIQIGEQCQRKEIYSAARQVMGDAFIRMQDFTSAREYFSMALEQNQNTFLTPYIMIHLGYCDIALGNIEAGFQLVREAEKICQKYGLGLIEADANLAYFSYYSNTGNWEACKERAKQCILNCEQRKLDFIKIFAEYFLGISFIQTGDPGHGLEILQKVANNAQSAHNFQAEILTRQSIAVFLKQTGQDSTANVGRIMVLLKHLEAHTQSQVFRERFQRLLGSVTREPGIPGLFSTF
jgi:predicted ATPase/DNA-binding SARP family transcriptional activator